jgi:hypothetical protein
MNGTWEYFRAFFGATNVKLAGIRGAIICDPLAIVRRKKFLIKEHADGSRCSVLGPEAGFYSQNPTKSTRWKIIKEKKICRNFLFTNMFQMVRNVDKTCFCEVEKNRGTFRLLAVGEKVEVGGFSSPKKV